MSEPYHPDQLKKLTYEEIRVLKNDVEQVFQELENNKKEDHLAMIAELMQEANLSPEDLAKRFNFRLDRSMPAKKDKLSQSSSAKYSRSI